MRTNITLDSDLIERLRKATEAKTQAKAVVIAIEDFLRRQKVVEIKKFKGRLRFRRDTATSRHHDR
jgi:putative antitoxin of VapBC-like toxin-antitoxin system